ncbi:MAG: hypothetical protein JWR51_4661 [Devosia sp.]|uniref:hypothetical protein n=1 Tax=Devosia sp. TaxID=1871048 RepID=UPI0026063A8F|nr:hypothetical protein [Devosia sp.]MDB5531558.1 hypothetical protein [Devosia sp.]
MNKENILKVADAIEQHSIPDLGFNMHNWTYAADSVVTDHSGHNCRTVACIAGWAARVATGHMIRDSYSEEVAAEFFGMDGENDDPAALFSPRNIDSDLWRSIDQQQAVLTLRHLAETGEVDWSVGAPVEAA